MKPLVYLCALLMSHAIWAQSSTSVFTSTDGQVVVTCYVTDRMKNITGILIVESTVPLPNAKLRPTLGMDLKKQRRRQ